MIFNLLLLQLLLFFGCGHSIPSSEIPCMVKLCPHRTQHIGCVDPEAISRTCEPRTEIIRVDENMSEHILQFVNVLRNMVASGYSHNLTVAARMPTMTWSHELAYAAGIVARQCDHDGYYCANTPNFHYVAVTELSGVTAKGTPAATIVIGQFLPKWLIDVGGCRMDSHNNIYPAGPGLCVGHYLPVIQDKGNRMGCVLRTSEPKPDTMTVSLICIFSRTNINGRRPYKVGKEPGENCLTGKHYRYPFLCSTDEMINNNDVSDDGVQNRLMSIQQPTCSELREFLKKHVNVDEL